MYLVKSIKFVLVLGKLLYMVDYLNDLMNE